MRLESSGGGNGEVVEVDLGGGIGAVCGGGRRFRVGCERLGLVRKVHYRFFCFLGIWCPI